MRRSLSLKRETLAPLSTEDLAVVAGGSHLCAQTNECTHGPSIDETCATLPVYQCLSINPGCSALCTV